MAHAGRTITELVNASGASSRLLEERSGGIVAHTWFDQIRKGKVASWPRRPEAINATAEALGVHPREVVNAYARQFGIDVEPDQSLLATLLPRSTRKLTSAQALALADLIRAFTQASDSAEEREALNLRNFDLGELRDVSAAWERLQEWAESAPAAVSYALTHLASVLGDAIRDATR